MVATLKKVVREPRAIKLERVIAVIGPPAVGKTTLIMRLGYVPGRQIFRLREHVPETILAATATSAERLGWIDDVTVTRALRGYIEAVVSDGGATRIVLLDNFPGNDMQAQLLLSILNRSAPTCVVSVVELVADPATIQSRVRERRVCHRCERDPIHDPRVPALPNPADPRRCARCNSVLQPRRGDAPRLLRARMQRYQRAAAGIREAFAAAGIEVVQIDSNRPPEQTACEVTTRVNIWSTPP
jgi:adenylate kinase